MRHSIDVSNISHERLHDEVIIINLSKAAYYAGSGTASDVWTLICQGASTKEATTLLAAAYGCEEAVVLRDLDACLGSLVERGVLQRDNSNSRGEAALELPKANRGHWTAPHFDEYMDMWDLLQFDPVHDVGEAGWPLVNQPPKI
jgi:coenzyme PQQ synthesis protein D (PqqD)